MRINKLLNYRLGIKDYDYVIFGVLASKHSITENKMLCNITASEKTYGSPVIQIRLDQNFIALQTLHALQQPSSASQHDTNTLSHLHALITR
jgi:hypothetical protein